MLQEKNIAIELKCQQYVCKTYMRNLEGTASVLMFESKQRTADVACPYCRGKVEICELANKHLKDIPVWQGILSAHESLAICYAMKEEMVGLFQLRSSEEAEAGWRKWFSAAKESGIPALVHFAELKEKRIEGLIAHAQYPISTGKLEGCNNKTKVAKRMGYGFRNDNYFFLLIQFLSVVPKVP